MTGTSLSAPAPIIVRLSAPNPAMYSKGFPLSLASISTSRAILSVLGPIGYPMFPAAFMIVSPGALNALPIRSMSIPISPFISLSVSPSISVTSNNDPFGRMSSLIPSLSPLTRLTLSRLPAISCAITAELVMTPSTMPLWISSAIRVVTPS